VNFCGTRAAEFLLQKYSYIILLRRRANDEMKGMRRGARAHTKKNHCENLLRKKNHLMDTQKSFA
jgi:hypothetical protein